VEATSGDGQYLSAATFAPHVKSPAAASRMRKTLKTARRISLSSRMATCVCSDRPHAEPNGPGRIRTFDQWIMSPLPGNPENLSNNNLATTQPEVEAGRQKLRVCERCRTGTATPTGSGGIAPTRLSHPSRRVPASAQKLTLLSPAWAASEWRPGQSGSHFSLPFVR
jgi:hypothetical protein